MYTVEEQRKSSLVSRERVNEFGEVFTGLLEIEGMLDLVKYECEREDSRFLEPACGSGNFLVAILKRKLDSISRKYINRRVDFERYCVQAISSLYGIDIIAENVKICRRRLLNCYLQNHINAFQHTSTNSCLKSVEYILNANIVQGDALTMTYSGENEGPINFAQWSFVGNTEVIRRDYEFQELLRRDCDALPGLFPHSPEQFRSDRGNTVFIPKPVKKYLPTHYLNIWKVGS